ncbi:MAG: alpha/beta fold hydrolase [Chloroflexota bacterium]
MATFVLVHGAWLGGWCWKKVVPRLRSHGHDAFTPTLTGLGDRAHLAGPAINLTSHIQDVVKMLEYEDLRGVILVGHSYGGMVITGVADRAADRIGSLVYLDAFLPEDGQALVDLIPPTARASLSDRVLSEGDGWQLRTYRPVPWEVYLRESWGVSAAADVEWIMERLQAQPFQTFTEPVRRRNPAAEKIDQMYILCNGGVPGGHPNGTFASAAEAAREAGSGWGYRELLTGHAAMVTAPLALADLLLDVTPADARA